MKSNSKTPNSPMDRIAAYKRKQTAVPQLVSPAVKQTVTLVLEAQSTAEDTVTRMLEVMGVPATTSSSRPISRKEAAQQFLHTINIGYEDYREQMVKIHAPPGKHSVTQFVCSRVLDGLPEEDHDCQRLGSLLLEKYDLALRNFEKRTGYPLRSAIKLMTHNPENVPWAHPRKLVKAAKAQRKQTNKHK